MTATAPLPRLSSLPPSRRRFLAVVAAVVLVLAAAIPLGLKTLHGSTSSGAEATSSPAAGKGSAGLVGPSARDAKTPAAATASAPASGIGAATTVVGEKIARTAWLGIKVTDLTGSAGRARVIATGAGGQVTSESVVTAVDPTGGPGAVDPGLGTDTSVPTVGVNEARMVLNVPAETLDEVLTQLSTLGTVSYRSAQSQDVTDTYVDIKARIQPMQDGIDRVRALLAKATDLQQIITLESELTRRQADLDSLTQRLAELDKITTTSDVTLTLWTDATAPSQPDTGLGGGLRTAWESLLGSLTVILTGLAALLPWLVLLVPLTLLGLRLWRRRAPGAPSATSQAAPAPAVVTTPQPVGAPASSPPASSPPVSSPTPTGPSSGPEHPSSGA